MNTIADRLALALEQTELTVADAIRRGGPSRPSIYRIQNDPSYSPEDYTLQRLAQSLDISFEWLKTGLGPMCLGGVAETTIPYRGMPPLDLARLAEVVQVLHQHLGARLPSKAFGALCAEAYLESILNPDLQQEALIERLQPLIRMALAGAG